MPTIAPTECVLELPRDPATLEEASIVLVDLATGRAELDEDHARRKAAGEELDPHERDGWPGGYLAARYLREHARQLRHAHHYGITATLLSVAHVHPPTEAPGVVLAATAVLDGETIASVIASIPHATAILGAAYDSRATILSPQATERFNATDWQQGAFIGNGRLIAAHFHRQDGPHLDDAFSTLPTAQNALAVWCEQAPHYRPRLEAHTDETGRARYVIATHRQSGTVQPQEDRVHYSGRRGHTCGVKRTRADLLHWVSLALKGAEAGEDGSPAQWRQILALPDRLASRRARLATLTGPVSAKSAQLHHAAEVAL